MNRPRHGWRREPQRLSNSQHIVVAPKPAPSAAKDGAKVGAGASGDNAGRTDVDQAKLSLARAQSKKTSIKSLRPPKALVLRKRNSMQRPSLSEQLAAIGGEASKLTSDIRHTHGLGAQRSATPLLAVPSMALVVGKLQSKHPSPVQFMADCVTYHFLHPFQSKEVRMEMFYRDMHDASVDTVNRTFSFRVPRTLVQFGDDYDPNNWQHRISIGLGSGVDCERVKTKVLPLIRA